MNEMVWRNSSPNFTRSEFRRKVTTVASVITKHTAIDIPVAVLSLLDTPRNGHTPRNCDSRILFTNIAEMMISIYSIITQPF
jgi:hypothetical protein